MKTRFQSLLEAKINEEIIKQTTSLAEGNSTTIESYRAVVGYIRGLRAALKLSEDVEGEMLG